MKLDFLDKYDLLILNKEKVDCAKDNLSQELVPIIDRLKLVQQDSWKAIENLKLYQNIDDKEQ